VLQFAKNHRRCYAYLYRGATFKDLGCCRICVLQAARMIVRISILIKQGMDLGRFGRARRFYPSPLPSLWPSPIASAHCFCHWFAHCPSFLPIPFAESPHLTENFLGCEHAYKDILHEQWAAGAARLPGAPIKGLYAPRSDSR
jgi:hypothetical protein